MSVPRSLQLPDGARAITVPSPFGDIAALRLDPEGESRGTVLLLAGFTGSKEDFLGVIGPIAAAGYSVVAVDQRGQYESIGVEEVTPDGYPLDEFAREAVAIVDAIGGPLHVVGHSFGGLVAQELALLAPDQVLSLTLMGTGPGAVPEEHHEILGTFIAGLPLVGKPTAWTMLRERDVRREGTPPEVEDFLARRFVSSSAGSLVGIARTLVTAPDHIDALAALGLRIQVVHGDEDDVWLPPIQRAMAERLGAPVRVIIDAGHSPNVDEPGATAAALVDFFSSSESS